MAQNNFILNLIASLNKTRSKQQIKADTKTLGDLYVKLIGCLNMAQTRKYIKNQLKGLSGNTFTITPSLNEKGIQAATKQTVNTAQKVANSNKIYYSFDVDKAKFQNQLKNFAANNSKLFSSKEMSAKYNNLLNLSNIAKSKTELNALRKQLAAFKTELIATNKAGMNWTDKFKASISRFSQYFSGASFIYAVTTQLRKTWTEAKILDDSLVSLQKVTSEISDRNALYKYFDKAMNKAQELNVKVGSLVDAVTEFKKMGWSLSDAELGGEWATVLENVGDVDINTAIGSIKTSIASFEEIGGYTNDQMDKKLEAYVDLINNMSNKYSINAQGLSEAIRLSAGTLTEAHTSIEQAATMFATANKYYNDPSYLGNTAKIGSLRMRASTGDTSAIEELQEMGEEIDSLTTASSKLREKLLSLTGVDIMVDDHTFKSYYDQLYEISQVIDQLDDTSRANVLETLFGKSRSAGGAALLSGMKESADAYKDAVNSAGSATEEYQTWMQSADAATQRFSNNLIQTYQQFINGNTVRDIANFGAAVLELGNKFGLIEGTVKGFLALKIGTFLTNGTMAFITAAKSAERYGSALKLVNNIPNGNLAQRFSTLKSIAQATSSLTTEQLKHVLGNQALTQQDRVRILQMQGMTKEMALQKLAEMSLTQATNAQTAANAASTVSTFNLKSAMVGLGASIKSVFLSNPVGITLMAISVGISAATSAISKHKQKIEETNEKAKEAKNSIDEINNTLNNNTSKTKEIAKEYAELAQGVDLLTNSNKNLSTEKHERFLELSNQLSELYPTLTKNFDDNGNAILDLSGNVDTIVSSLDDLIDRQKQIANQEILDKMPDLYKGYANNVKKYKRELNDAKEELEQQEGQLEYAKPQMTFAKNGEYNLEATEYIRFIRELGYKAVEVSSNAKNTTYEVRTNDNSRSVSLDEITNSEKYKNIVNNINKATEEVKFAQQQLEAETSSFNKYINIWLNSDSNFAYSQLEDKGLGKAVQDMLFNFDPDSLPDDIKNDWDKTTDYLQRNILFAINNIDDSVVSKALSKVYSDTELPDEKIDYIQEVQKYFDDKYGNDNSVSIALKIKLQETQTLQNQFEDVVTRFKQQIQDDSDVILINPGFEGEVDKKQETLLRKYFAENNLLTSKGIDKFNEYTKGAKSATEAIQMFEDAVKKAANSSFSTKFESLNDSFSKLTENANLLSSINKEISENGRISADNLSKINEAFPEDKYPEMAKALYKYRMELISEKELFDELENAYNSDSQKYANLLKSETETNVAFYNTLKEKYPDFFNNLNKLYREDFKNWKSIADMKKGVELDLIKTLGKEWMKYYTVFQNEDGTYGYFGNGFDAGSLGLSEEETKALEEQINTENNSKAEQYVNRMNEVIKEIDKMLPKYKASSWEDVADKDKDKDSTDAWKEEFDKKLAFLDHYHQMGYLKDEQYYRELNELNEEYFANQEEYLDDYRSYSEKIYEGLKQAYKDTLDEQLGYMGQVVNAVTDYLDDEIDTLEDEKDAIEESYNIRIEVLEDEKKALEDQQDALEKQKDNIQDEIDAIEKANEARQKAIDLQKKQYELNRAMNQNTNHVYVDGQMVWRPDDSSIRDARNELEDAKTQSEIDKLQDKIDELDKVSDSLDDQKDAIQANIDALNDELDKITEGIDKQIDALQTYRDRWAEIPDQYDYVQNKMIATMMLGQDWQIKALASDEEMLYRFGTSYNNVQGQLQIVTNASAQDIIRMANLSSNSLGLLAAEADSSLTEMGGSIQENSILSQEAFDNLMQNGTMSLQTLSDNVGAISNNICNSITDVILKVQEACIALSEFSELQDGMDYISPIPITPMRDGGILNVTAMKTGGTVEVETASKGTVTGSHRSRIAKSLGEDHLVVAREGEGFVPPEQVKDVQNSVTAVNDFAASLVPYTNEILEKLKANIDKIKPMPFDINWGNIKPNSYVNDNSLQQNNTINIQSGAIVLNEVENAEQLGDAIINILPNYVTQRLNKK